MRELTLSGSHGSTSKIGISGTYFCMHFIERGKTDVSGMFASSVEEKPNTKPTDPWNSLPEIDGAPVDAPISSRTFSNSRPGNLRNPVLSTKSCAGNRGSKGRRGNTATFVLSHFAIVIRRLRSKTFIADFKRLN